MLCACPQEQSHEEGKRARTERSTKDRQEVETGPAPTQELQVTTPVTRKRKTTEAGILRSRKALLTGASCPCSDKLVMFPGIVTIASFIANRTCTLPSLAQHTSVS